MEDELGELEWALTGNSLKAPHYGLDQVHGRFLRQGIAWECSTVENSVWCPGWIRSGSIKRRILEYPRQEVMPQQPCKVEEWICEIKPNQHGLYSGLTEYRRMREITWRFQIGKKTGVNDKSYKLLIKIQQHLVKSWISQMRRREKQTVITVWPFQILASTLWFICLSPHMDWEHVGGKDHAPFLRSWDITKKHILSVY